MIVITHIVYYYMLLKHRSRHTRKHTGVQCIGSPASLFIYVCIYILQVCNHPDLFERRDVVSPLSLAVPSPSLPRLLHHHIHRGNAHRRRYNAYSASWFRANLTAPDLYAAIHNGRV